MEDVMSAKLSGKTALITGASAGIGWASALALAGEGVNLVLTARRQEHLTELEAAVQTAGGKAISFAGDAKEENTARQAVDLAVKTFGSLDILINNVGIGNYKNLVDTSADDYDEMMDSNVRSTFLFTRYAVPVMIQ
jgi:NAD(P)-dependent dehydrogenase (short-subunit alcohol dehydrogenase family)